VTHMPGQASRVLVAQSGGGGAELNEVIGLTAVAVAVSFVLLGIGYLHRTQRITWLTSLADRTGRRFKRPSWEALPLVVLIATTNIALFGFIWDVSLHIGKGRDPGPLANPAHYFILVGLALVFLAGALIVVIPFGKPGTAAVRITRHWYAPVGGVILSACGLYALLGFPLDDIWHRIFGQDVTLWGPTHLMMIGGAGISVLATLFLEREGNRSKDPDIPPDRFGINFVKYLGFGGLLIGMSVFQVEYDFGVAQFRLVLQPMLIAAAAAITLVAARLWLGRGAAIAAALLAVAMRGIIALLVGPVLGAPISWFPLYLGPAIVIELVALTPLIKKPVIFGIVGGLGISTLGLWIESLWIGAVYDYPWPTSMWPEALSMSVPVAVAMGACGALAGMVMTGRRLPARPIAIGIVVLMVLIVGGAVANGLRHKVPPGTATLTLTDAPSVVGQRMVSAEVRIDPPDLVSDNPEWVSILSWQGGLANERGLAIQELNRLGPGYYRTTQPVPVWGQWKTLLRIQDGTTLTAVPIFLPADHEIGAPETPAQESMTRKFVEEITLLQRERGQDIPAWLWAVACLVVGLCTLALIAALTWGGGRINRTEQRGDNLDGRQLLDRIPSETNAAEPRAVHDRK
jgi:hypothetical protein